jgi:hypothetical protein
MRSYEIELPSSLRGVAVPVPTPIPDFIVNSSPIQILMFKNYQPQTFLLVLGDVLEECGLETYCNQGVGRLVTLVTSTCAQSLVMYQYRDFLYEYDSRAEIGDKNINTVKNVNIRMI